MKLPSHGLQAFLAVARSGSFTAAAKSQHITQSALSQRILNLEDELQTTLIIRDPSALKLTTQGDELLKFCQQQEKLEQEVLGKILAPSKSPVNELSGSIRVGGYSSVMQSVIMPALSGLMKKNSRLEVTFIVTELRELPGLLRTGKVDFLVLDHALKRPGTVSHLLGHEEYVWVRGKNMAEREGVFLDHDAEDLFSYEFFKLQGRKDLPRARSFLGSIAAIIEGVTLGWGEAIVPRHLIRGRKEIKVVERQKPMRVPVYLNYFEQPYYTRLQEKVIEELTKGELTL